jgi:protein-disulfide isomerase
MSEKSLKSSRERMLLVFGVLGLMVAALSGLSEHVGWLQSICTGLSGSCRETVGYTLLRVPLWAWGVGFYLVLILSILGPRRWLVWLLAGAAGMEATLVWIMASTSTICVYCLVNLVVVLILLGLAFERARFWPMLSTALIFFMVTINAISHENKQLSAASKNGDKEVIAEVGGDAITQKQLESSLRQRLYDLERQMYQLKRQRLDQIIMETVLRKEAARKKITPQQLVNDQVLSKEAPVTDQDVEQYLQANPARRSEWRGTEEDLESRVKTFLTQERDYAKVVEYAKSLESKYHVSILLKEPSPPFLSFKTDGGHAMGPRDAPVKVIEFSDYECPACRSAHQTVKAIRDMYKGKLRWVFRDFPLKIHKEAEIAAEAAQCAADQNKFWEYQDILYSSKDPLTADTLEGYAGQLGLSTDQFKQCLESHKYKAKIQKEVEEAQAAGIDRTPSFIVNGNLMMGAPPLERFKQGIDAELKKVEEKK